MKPIIPSLAVLIWVLGAAHLVAADGEIASRNLENSNYAGKRLMGEDFSNANLRSASFSRGILRGANFHGADLTKTDFRQADVRGCDFQESTGLGVDQGAFRNAIYSRSTRWPEGFNPGPSALLAEDLEAPPALPAAATVANEAINPEVEEAPAIPQLPGSRPTGEQRPLSGVNHQGKDLSGADFSGQYLAGANFEATVLTRTNFRKADLTGALFTAAEVNKTIFDGADLTNADFSKAIINQASFVNARLINANLAGQTLHLKGWIGYFKAGANKLDVDYRTQQTLTALQADDLHNGDLIFKGANLQRSVIYGNLEGVNFRSADLRGADLSNTENADSRFFKGAKYDSRTIWGKIDPKAIGATLSPDLDYGQVAPDNVTNNLTNEGAATRFVGNWVMPEGEENELFLYVRANQSYSWGRGEEVAEGDWRLSQDQADQITIPTGPGEESWTGKQINDDLELRGDKTGKVYQAKRWNP